MRTSDWEGVWSRGLIVSCQPVVAGPLDRDDIVLAMAQAAAASGASAVRIEGVQRVALVARSLSIPVVGIVKRPVPGSPVFITPVAEDVRALAAAGAAVVAFDATQRTRPSTVPALADAAHACGVDAMADCATLADGLQAWQAGCELVGTTLSGYTADTAVAEDAPPDFGLIRALALQGVRVVAEGRIRTPQQAAEALDSGALCVTVGSAITRVEHITQWFVQALRPR
ncbi:MAG: putative N-acetylmannosamine-6-phosphate 2-epimerase [Rhodoferax sp.]